MSDPLSVAASIAGVATAATQSIQFLYQTIGDIKDVPNSLKDINSELESIEAVVRKVKGAVEGADSDVVLADDIKKAAKNCDDACSRFQKKVAKWTKHSTEDETFWTDKWRIGMFEQKRIESFKGQLNSSKASLNLALSTAQVLTTTRQGFIMEDMKNIMLEGNQKRLEEDANRAQREYQVIEAFLQSLSAQLTTDISKEYEQNLQELIEEIQAQKESNEALQKTCADALAKTKNSLAGIKQVIKNTKAEDNSKAYAGIIGADVDVKDVDQNISDTFASGGSISLAGILGDVDLSMPARSSKP